MKPLITALAATVSSAALALAAEAGDATAAYAVERVSFVSDGSTLIGNLYIPAGADAASPSEGVVVTGAWTTIKEQMPGLYAAELAEQGYVALAFDFRTWGESEGPTRSFENPELKIADIEAAGRFLSTRPEVAAVNGLGICASSGYMATAAERTDLFSAVALVAPWLHDAALVDAVYGGPESVASLIDTGRRAAQAEADTGEPQLIPASGPTGSDALMAMEGYYFDPERGRVPEWENTFNLASWEGWLTFDAIRAAPGVDEPLLIVHSEAAAIPDGAHRFYDALTGDKEALWLEDVTQFDFYDQAIGVTPAVDAVAAFFAKS
ncbi:MAG: hypothetical protein MI723_00210 [Caulobacterales bacterium]|nr:hypothetical protein [Caulobacterales bacterium]